MQPSQWGPLFPSYPPLLEVQQGSWLLRLLPDHSPPALNLTPAQDWPLPWWLASLRSLSLSLAMPRLGACSLQYPSATPPSFPAIVVSAATILLTPWPLTFLACLPHTVLSSPASATRQVYLRPGLPPVAAHTQVAASPHPFCLSSSLFTCPGISGPWAWAL